MTTIAMAILWATIAGLVGFAAYRQVREHIQLRRALDSLAETHNLLMDRLTAATESLAEAYAEEEAPSVERAPGGGLTRYLESFHGSFSFCPEDEAFSLKAFRMPHEQLAQRYLTHPLRHVIFVYPGYATTGVTRAVIHQGQCIRSSDDLIRMWQEEEDYRLLIQAAEAGTV